MNPGMASWPCRSITCVEGPVIFLISSAVPSAWMRSLLIAIAAASGRLSSTVTMRPLVRTRSAGGACAVPPTRWARAWEESPPTITAKANKYAAVFRMREIIATVRRADGSGHEDHKVHEDHEDL